MLKRAMRPSSSIPLKHAEDTPRPAAIDPDGEREGNKSSSDVVSGAIDCKSDSQVGVYLEAMEKLRALLEGNDEVSVPGVVVAGAQSAGKSSVLEALGGMKLPRGQNITTRVPLVLNVRAVPGAVQHALIGGVEDEGARKRIEIEEISDNIEALTNELAGGGGGVSDTPIYLTIIRPSGPNLTLIDLPGITFNAADGSSDIHEKTVDLVKKYIRDENMVILACMPASSDFANCEAILLAREFDPHGRRTLGVVTKTDDVQPGSNIKAKLRMEARQMRLNLGFVAVINRTPIEVKNNTPAVQVRARENRFFTTNAEVKGLDREFWGMDTLVERIVAIQAERIQEFIPAFLTQSKTRIKELRQELGAMPSALASDNEIWEAYRTVISKVEVELKEVLVSGSDIATMNVVPDVTAMYREFAEDIRKDLLPDFFTDEYHEKVITACKRVDGMALTHLLHGRAFSPLFREVFAADLAPRSLALVEGVNAYMQKALSTLCDRACPSGYPALLKQLKTNLIDGFMDSKEAMAKTSVKVAIQAELGWSFTQDPSYEEILRCVHDTVIEMRNTRVAFDATAAAASESSGRQPPGPEPARAVGDVPKEFIEKMIACKGMGDEEAIYKLQVIMFAYSDVVCRRVFDTVPKHVHLYLVNGVCEGFVSWMLENVDKTDLRKWLAEDPSLQRDRKEKERKLAQFEEAVQILRDMPSSSPSSASSDGGNPNLPGSP